MNARSKTKSGGKTSRSDSTKLGRSAATGLYVLRPASKAGSVSVKAATKAAEKVISTGEFSAKLK